MANEKELRFVVFLIHALASAWGRSPAEVYAKLMESGILNKYIIPSYDMLHTLGREYLVEDITECMQEWGYQVCGYEVVCDHSELRSLCRQKQEEQIILRLSETTGMSLDRAMATYYASALSRQIEEGVWGLDNLDAAYLVEDLIENEPELFAERSGD